MGCLHCHYRCQTLLPAGSVDPATPHLQLGLLDLLKIRYFAEYCEHYFDFDRTLNYGFKLSSSINH